MSNIAIKIKLLSNLKQDAVVKNGRLRLRCSHVANWTKHTCRLYFWRIPCIIRKPDVTRKTGSTQLIALTSC